MKYKTTQKAVRGGYWKTISIGYCDLQHLLYGTEPIAYTCGVYGWNADIYHFGNKAIVTGYRPFGNVHPRHDLIREYENRAKEIINNNPLCSNEEHAAKKAAIRELREEFIVKACE